MAMTEQARHELYETLKEVLGMAPATTLMEAIPPVGWADIATRRDLDHLETVVGLKLDAEIAGVRTEIAGLRMEMHDLKGELLRNVVLAVLTIQATFAGLILAVVG